MIHQFSFPTRIHFGAGARRLAGPYLREAGIARPLIVTDKGVAGLPMTTAFVEELRTDALAISIS